MRFSYKVFTPKYQGGELDKTQAMKACARDYNTFYAQNSESELEQLGKSFQNYYVYSNIVWKDNHRKIENAVLEEIDMLIIDIDNGLTISEVLCNTPFQIMTLTTTSHTEEHHKFRVFILLEEPISLKDNIEYRELLKLIDSKYFNSQSDKACFEVGRAFITTGSAKYQINGIKEMLDCSVLLKEAKISALGERLKSQPLFNHISTKEFTIEQVKQFPKVKDLVGSFGEQNHYRPVFQILGIAKKAGLSDQDAVNLVMSYNIGGEYSDFNDLMKKVKRYR
ncbi:hypothetical protein HUE87_11780 [Candidatus Sulfurimonas marisnigri]|uniref:Primase C-terminal 1 domain-containing protein n=1 Tax=Candidatus Sulfurimonas marisnigri TaxID=2740405 RepID=A0A7S7M0V2_9BACT|nr:hypothetical protein [Candidatus Sulfurimonas marisnigri]QOY54528.1 hypothetical protein HUE87_11780 [Candidatus Sulfurimonas marisnigri]